MCRRPHSWEQSAATRAPPPRTFPLARENKAVPSVPRRPRRGLPRPPGWALSRCPLHICSDGPAIRVPQPPRPSGRPLDVPARAPSPPSARPAPTCPGRSTTRFESATEPPLGPLRAPLRAPDGPAPALQRQSRWVLTRGAARTAKPPIGLHPGTVWGGTLGSSAQGVPLPPKHAALGLACRDGPGGP